MSTGSSPGQPCVVCGHTPAFSFSGKAKCWKHLLPMFDYDPSPPTNEDWKKHEEGMRK